MDNHLTLFEKVRVLGVRATQLADGAPPTIDMTGITDPAIMAKMELQARTIPILIHRTYPNGQVRILRVCDMIY